MKMFKAENPKLVNGRFRTFKGCLFVAAIKKMIQLHGIANGKEGNADDLAVFVFRLLGIKSKDKKKYSNDIESKGEQVQDCMYKYSHHKFKRVCAIPGFQVLFEYVYRQHLDSILDDDPSLHVHRQQFAEIFRTVSESMQTRSNNL